MSEPPVVSETAQARLKALAAAVLEATAKGTARPRPDLEGELGVPRACFVSYHLEGGELRGCIGTLTPSRPLGVAVVEMAEAAASRDPRFPPIAPDELAAVEIEISVLGPFLDVADPGEIVPGVHGLQIEKGGRAGILLPQVAAEYGWDRETFLDQTCVKAGLPRGAWRGAGVRIRRFTAQVF